MANKLWTDWFDEILPEMPGCPQDYAKHHIKQSAIEFCSLTKAWRVDQEPISSSVGVHTYEFEIPDKTDITQILQLWYDGTQITPKSADELGKIYKNWNIEAGTPIYYLQETPDTFRLVPIPDTAKASAITAKLAIQPSRDATGLDAAIFQNWFHEIAAGAKARLYASPKKPYTDLKLADYYRQMFMQDCGSASFDASRGMTRAPISTAIRDSYRGLGELPVKRITTTIP